MSTAAAAAAPKRKRSAGDMEATSQAKASTNVGKASKPAEKAVANSVAVTERFELCFQVFEAVRELAIKEAKELSKWEKAKLGYKLGVKKVAELLLNKAEHENRVVISMSLALLGKHGPRPEDREMPKHKDEKIAEILCRAETRWQENADKLTQEQAQKQFIARIDALVSNEEELKAVRAVADIKGKTDFLEEQLNKLKSA